MIPLLKNSLCSTLLFLSSITIVGACGAPAGPAFSLASSAVTAVATAATASSSSPLGSNFVGEKVYPIGKSPLEIYTGKYEKLILSSDSAIKIDAQRRLGIAYHHLGVIDQEGRVEQAHDLLEKVLEANPDDNEARMFYGSSKTLIARDSWNPFIKMSSVGDGIELIDQAVANAPNNLTIRVARANNSLNLPEFLGRGDLAKQDFLEVERLYKNSESVPGILQDPQFGIPAENSMKVYVSQSYYKLGKIYQSEDNIEKAISYYQQSAKLLPGTAWSNASKEALKLLN